MIVSHGEEARARERESEKCLYNVLHQPVHFRVERLLEAPMRPTGLAPSAERGLISPYVTVALLGDFDLIKDIVPVADGGGRGSSGVATLIGVSGVKTLGRLVCEGRHMSTTLHFPRKNMHSTMLTKQTIT